MEEREALVQGCDGELARLWNADGGTVAGGVNYGDEPATTEDEQGNSRGVE
jgi:hypothetical protein